MWGGDPKQWCIELAFGHNRLAAYQWLVETRSVGDAEPWSRMPVDARLLDDEQMAQLAWSENEKRRDLNPIERAQAIQRRIESFGWTHELAAERLGISRPTVSNSLRLLKLPKGVQGSLRKGEITERQALALAPLFEVDQQLALEYDFNFTVAAIVGMARDGSSSELIRQRVSEALRWLDKQTQPELETMEELPDEEMLVIKTPEAFQRQTDETKRKLMKEAWGQPAAKKSPATTESDNSKPAPENEPPVHPPPPRILTMPESELKLVIILKPFEGDPLGRPVHIHMYINGEKVGVKEQMEKELWSAGKPVYLIDFMYEAEKHLLEPFIEGRRLDPLDQSQRITRVVHEIHSNDRALREIQLIQHSGAE